MHAPQHMDAPACDRAAKPWTSLVSWLKWCRNTKYPSWHSPTYRINQQARKSKQNKTKQNKTKQNKTKQNKTKQNKTKQSKTKQNKHLTWGISSFIFHVLVHETPQCYVP